MNRISCLLYLGASLLLALSFTYFYFLYTNEYPQGSFERMANFEADKVFQTRLLITTIANALEPCLPALRFTSQWIVPYPIGYEVLLQLLNAFFLTLLLWIMPLLLNCLNYHVNKWICLLVIVPIAWNYIVINGFLDGAGLYYPYDIPSLTFFALGIILFMRKKWLWFYPVFILACLNRESACFISLGGFILNFNFSSRKIKEIIFLNKQIVVQSIIQFMIWSSSRVVLSYLCRNNPGDFFEQPHSMIDFLTTLGSGQGHWAMQNPLWFLTLFAGIWIIPLVKSKNLNKPSRRFLGLGLVYFFVLTQRSNMMETRVYNELNVILSSTAICCAFGKKNYIEQNPSL